MLNQLEKKLQKSANPKQAELLQRFFKTNPGEYGEGDLFLGIKVPVQRQIAKQFLNLQLREIQTLLNSKTHEKRLIALLILIEQYKKSLPQEKQEIFNFYIQNTKNINNWDLVDLSAPNIVGNYLLDKPRDILYNLAYSANLWEKRIAIISTSAFIRNNEFQDTIKISELLLKETHDLMHKAVGWMLREMGKRNQSLLEQFLKQHYSNIPRTTLRYAIEKFPENIRKKILRGEI